MIFEKGWFLRKMNKYAPSGYTFVALGKEGRIAMRATDITGDQEPRGPFVSNMSFEMLDCVYGGLLTRRNSHIRQSDTPSDYLMAYDIARPQTFAPDAKTAQEQDSKYEMYRAIARAHIHTPNRPCAPFMRKNALLIQGMQDGNLPLPSALSERLNNYVNKCTWYAIEKVLSSMPIGDMKYYQNLYREKMAELDITYGQKFGMLNADKIANAKRHHELTIDIEHLTYDVLPKQQKSLSAKQSKFPEDVAAHEKLRAQINDTNSRIRELSQERDSVAPKEPYRPAREALRDVFYKDGSAIRPEFSKHGFIQFLQMIKIRENKNHTK